MDDIDRTVLSKLCSDCRVTYEYLARKTGLSPNAVKNRVQHLLENGVVHRFSVTIDPGLIDADSFQAILLTDGSEDVDEFVDTLGKSPMVGHISTLASTKGGAYLVWGQYIGTEMLNELGKLLRAPEQVQEVEFHTMYNYRQKRALKFTKMQKKVIRCLIENPRMSISEISQRLESAPKTVRRALREIVDDKKVKLLARPDLASGGLVNTHIRIVWDEKASSLEEVWQWCRTEYPVAFWSGWPSAFEPVFFAEFFVRDLQEAVKISKQVRKADFVKTSVTLVTYSNAKYTYLGEILLKEMLEKAGV
ncbi:MAG: winged helix-turn-helix transcriptional regulator [Candidatus Thorarchaeota archaeon]